MLMPIIEAPYYGLKKTLFSSVTHGGITKNEKAEVTKIDGEVIPGLYAAGELTTVTNSNGTLFQTGLHLDESRLKVRTNT